MTHLGSLIILLKKEYLVMYRKKEIFTGILLFTLMSSVLLSFILRKVSVRVEELGLVAIPALWIIFIFTILRYCIQSFSFEVRNSVFQTQLGYGFHPNVIFLSKIISGIVFGSIILVLQFACFYILLGFPAAARPLAETVLVFFFTLPGLISLSSVGAVMSLKSSNEEILIPIIVLPLLIFLTISVISLVEVIFSGNHLDLSLFWCKTIFGLSAMFFILSMYLFSFLISAKD